MKNQRNKESIIGEAVDSDSYRGKNQMVLEIYGDINSGLIELK